ncbi:hypothetical protein [Actinoplanes sp. NPDC049681]|uniref:hypothetical protein n=1 Tax=Actinoplanes sp. NPDC049681 TaxID=3363905 RepID=UPI0037BD8247
MFGYENLTAGERQLHDAVEQQALATGRDTQDLLLEHPDGEAYNKARVAEVFGGPGAGEAFRDLHTRRALEWAAETADTGNPDIVRRFDDGRTAIAHATHDGRSLLEYADGSREVINACDTQHVGPDPDVMAGAQASQERADHTREMAALMSSPESAARSLEIADRLQKSADDQRAHAFDWMKQDMHADHAARERAAGDGDEF